MAISHSLGFPRIGADRELKKAVEAYWRGDMEQASLIEEGRRLRTRHWRMQQDAGLDLVPVGDFAWYDQMLNHSLMVGAIPERFGQCRADDLDTLFRMARGRAPDGEPAAACEMTKWFDTNYHYIVPELHRGQKFHLASDSLLQETREALAQGFRAKPVLIGPLTWLWLGKIKGESFNRLELLDELLDVYREVLTSLSKLDVEWVQIDEPILILDLPAEWQQAFELAYNQLQSRNLKIMLATYFGELNGTTTSVINLPVDGLHVDLVRGKKQLAGLVDRLPPYKVLSAGVVNGRNVWKADLSSVLDELKSVQTRLEDRLWVAPSCSLLHVPVDLDREHRLDDELKSWLAFAVQKCREVAVLGQALGDKYSVEVRDAFAVSDTAVENRNSSERIHNPLVQERVAAIGNGLVGRPLDQRLSAYQDRSALQKARLNLPLFPTTTIGSFPQTKEIRRQRNLFRKGEVSEESYRSAMQEEIRETVKRQEELGLDVLVHGEAERNDMVEYFGEQLDGFAFTRNGWVQSYGSRCVKPPLIIGDISRPQPMTVEWSRFAQGQTSRVMKGMITGPVTILCWSFPREDIHRRESCLQLALLCGMK